MAHYAFLDSNNIVTDVIVGRDESDTSQDWEVYYGNIRGQTCKRTSYNTRGGIHSGDGVPFRKNYAGIGYSYDSTRDAFIIQKPFDSWTLNEDTCWWEAPVAYPTDYNGLNYSWNELNQTWDIVE
tara:strand:+ start:1501 stop:1875 length:375 start_codon:yes stop_codon:yes gene_type:complete